MDRGNPINFIVKNAAKTIPVKKLFGQVGEVEITILADNHYVRVGDIESDYPSGALPAPLATNATVASTTLQKTDAENVVKYGASGIDTGVGFGDILRVTSSADAELGHVRVVKVESGVITVKKLNNFTSTAGDKVIKFVSTKLTSAAKAVIKLSDLFGDSGNITMISDNASATTNVVMKLIPPVTATAKI